MNRLEDKIYACLLGGLIGDAMGAPVEGKHFRDIEEKHGPDGVTDFSGVGTDDTAIREQLIKALLTHGGHVNCDTFAQTFLDSRAKNYGLWWVPVRNMFHKLDSKIALPVDAGYGNTPSSSSAMAISPMGIINAANPRQAVRETFDVASLIHSGPSGFCRDAACVMAAAVAQAFAPDATVDSIILSATAYLHPVSAQQIREAIRNAFHLLQRTNGYKEFRAAYYEHCLQAEQCDSRETVPATLALFALAKGDSATAIRYGANFGRDTDTIATMVGGLCGAFGGTASLPDRWQKRVIPEVITRYTDNATRLAELVRRRAEKARQYADRVASLAEGNIRSGEETG